jgi:hypothetical protein
MYIVGYMYVPHILYMYIALLYLKWRTLYESECGLYDEVWVMKTWVMSSPDMNDVHKM